MYLLIFPSIFFIIIFASLIKLLLSKKVIKHKKKILIFCLIVHLTFIGYFIDTLAVLTSYSGAYDLPYKKGTITQVRLNNKVGAPSTLVMNNKEYHVDIDLVKHRKFYVNKKYKIIYTPFTKTIIKIHEVKKAF